MTNVSEPKFNFSIKSTLNFINNSIIYLNKALDYDYPSNHLVTLIELLIDILVSITSKIEDLKNKFQIIDDREILIDQLTEIDQVLLLLNKIFPILENSKSKLIKPEITYIIEEIKELLNENDINYYICL